MPTQLKIKITQLYRHAELLRLRQKNNSQRARQRKNKSRQKRPEIIRFICLCRLWQKKVYFFTKKVTQPLSKLCIIKIY